MREHNPSGQERRQAGDCDPNPQADFYRFHNVIPVRWYRMARLVRLMVAVKNGAKGYMAIFGDGNNASLLELIQKLLVRIDRLVILV